MRLGVTARERLRAGLADRNVVAALAAAMLVTLVTRIVPAATQGLWGDEYYTHQVLSAPTLTKTFAAVVHSEATPGMFYAVQWLVTHVTGTSDFGLRVVSILCATLVVPAVFVLGRWLGGRSAGLFAAAICAVHPLLIWYGSEARSYAFVLLLLTVAWWAYVRMLEQPTADRVLIWACLACPVVATHYFGSMIVLSQGLWAFAVRRELRVRLLAVGVLLGAVGAAAGPTWGAQTDKIVVNPFAEIALQTRVRDALSMLVDGVSAPTWHLAIPGMALALLAIGLLALTRDLPLRGRAVTLVGPALLAAVLALTVGADYFNGRNVIGLFPVFVVLVATGVTHAPARVVGAVIGGGLLAIFVAASAALLTDVRLQRSDWRQVADDAGAPAPGKVVVAVGNFFANPLQEYLDRPRIASFPRATEIVVVGARAPAGRSGCYNGAMCSVTSAEPVARPAIRGIRRVSVDRVGLWTIARYRATEGPVRIDLANAPRLFAAPGFYQYPRIFGDEPR